MLYQAKKRGSCLTRPTTIILFLNLLSFPPRDLDKIDSLMQDITESQEVAQEICDAISRPFGDAFDEVTYLLLTISQRKTS